MVGSWGLGQTKVMSDTLRLTEETLEALSARLGAKVEDVTDVDGGSINDAFLLRLSDGRNAFFKTRKDASFAEYRAEALGLEWLRGGGGQAPDTLAVLSEGVPGLCLEWIDSGSWTRKSYEELGKMLAALHRTSEDYFGGLENNRIGPLLQKNEPRSSWSVFYSEFRLTPLVKAAHRRKLIDDALLKRFETLIARSEKLWNPKEKPARIHGDLWSGNIMVDKSGKVYLIDPAAYSGHREIDIAMLSLFAPCEPRILASYNEVFKLSPGAEDRRALCELYPLLVHLNLFGRIYLPEILKRLDYYD